MTDPSNTAAPSDFSSPSINSSTDSRSRKKYLQIFVFLSGITLLSVVFWGGYAAGVQRSSDQRMQDSLTLTESDQDEERLPSASFSPAPVVTMPPEQQSTELASQWLEYSGAPGVIFDIPADWQDRGYVLESNDGEMSIWIKQPGVGLTCLTQISENDQLILNQQRKVKMYRGADGENCDTSENRALFFEYEVNAQRYSFTFSYSEKNSQDAEQIFDQVVDSLRFAQ